MEPTENTFDTNNWNHQNFRDRIIRATEGYEIAISEIPSTIDLTGAFGEMSDRLVRDTTNNELATHAKVSSGKLLLSNNIIEGSERRVSPYIGSKIGFEHIDFFNPQYSRLESRAVTIHTHPIEYPPSPADIRSLLVDSVDGGTQAEIVLARSTRYLILRTVRTPSLGIDESDLWVSGQNEMLAKQLEGQVSQYISHMQKAVGFVEDSNLKNFISKTEILLQLRNLYKVCEKSSLVLFASPGNNKYSKEAAEQIKRLTNI